MRTMAFAYIVRCSDDSYYAGSSARPRAQDLAAQRRRSTVRRTPATEGRSSSCGQAEFEHIGAAFAVEKQIQGWSRAKREALIRGDYDALPELASRPTARKTSTDDEVVSRLVADAPHTSTTETKGAPHTSTTDGTSSSEVLGEVRRDVVGLLGDVAVPLVPAGARVLDQGQDLGGAVDEGLDDAPWSPRGRRCPGRTSAGCRGAGRRSRQGRSCWGAGRGRRRRTRRPSAGWRSRSCPSRRRRKPRRTCRGGSAGRAASP